MQINPYLNFNGNCEAAITFYQQVLGGELGEMVPFGDTPACGDMPPEWKTNIMHARLVIGDNIIMASDCPRQYQEKAAGFNLSINVDSPTEADRIFNALAENGQITMALDKTFWAERFGMLVDQYGTPWMINCVGATEAK